MQLDQTTAARLCRVALGHVTREYPHKLDHVLEGDADAQPPRMLHPIFHGSFDWHSCVHGWWTLLTLSRLYPGMDEARAIDALARQSFTPIKVAGEFAYLERPSSRGFERPYGWAWLLYLHLEASRRDDPFVADALAPLARAFAARLRDYLQLLTYPIRVGTHFNTPFALILAFDWAGQFDLPLAELIRDRGTHWFGRDQNCQAWEPGGDEFLSPALSEALLMSKLLEPIDFERWIDAFLPGLSRREPATLFTPATVSDRSDGKIAHLDGLNLSRAWCWRLIAQHLPKEARDIAEGTANDHLIAAAPHIAGDYAGEHWLASFALLAVLAKDVAASP